MDGMLVHRRALCWHQAHRLGGLGFGAQLKFQPQRLLPAVPSCPPSRKAGALLRCFEREATRSSQPPGFLVLINIFLALILKIPAAGGRCCWMAGRSSMTGGRTRVFNEHIHASKLRKVLPPHQGNRQGRFREETSSISVRQVMWLIALRISSQLQVIKS